LTINWRLLKIAFENSSYPGYTTEKMFEPMLVRSIPIYWGNPLVGKDFNTAAFVNYYDCRNDKELLERVIELDQRDDLYLSMLEQPAYPDNQLPSCVDKRNIQKQFEKIIYTARSKPPVAQTHRKFYYSAERFISKADFHVNSIFKYRKNFR
jgi:alpha(1,3/1,4) fucosyltransferase